MLVDLIEITTVMRNMIQGGAAARLIETYHKDLDIKLSIRIAPELYFQMLIVH